METQGPADQIASVLDRIVAQQQKDGSIGGAKTTITRSGGQALLVGMPVSLVSE